MEQIEAPGEKAVANSDPNRNFGESPLVAMPEQDYREMMLVWTRTGNPVTPYATIRGEIALSIRVNDLPGKPAYSLIVDAKEIESFDRWPPNWKRPFVRTERDAYLSGIQDFLRSRAPGRTEGAFPQAEIRRIRDQLETVKELDPKIRRPILLDAARSTRRYLVEAVGDAPFGPPAAGITMKTFDSLLEELKRIKPDSCNVVELRVFLGLNSVETATALGIAFMLCDRKWYEARRWMRERFNSADAVNAGPSK
jgi:hypothetical protein